MKLLWPKAAPDRRVVNLRDLGFVGYVSDQAREEIESAERRRARELARWNGGNPP